MADAWKWFIAPPSPHAGGRTQLTTAQSRTLTFRLDGQAEVSWQCLTTSDDAHAIGMGTLHRDLIILRGSDLIFRGRLGPANYASDGTKPTVQYGAIDYRGMLSRRMIGSGGRLFTNVAQGLIAWTLIAESQAVSGGDLGITEGVGTTGGPKRIRTFDPGKYIGDLIGDMGRVDGGFDWEVSPDLEFNVWHRADGGRGTLRSEPLVYGSQIMTYGVKFDPGKYATSVMAIGSDVTIPAHVRVAQPWLTDTGIIESSQGFTSIKEQDTLDARAVSLLAEKVGYRPDITVTLRPDLWAGRDALWLGDTSRVVIHEGVIDIDGPHRVKEIKVTVSDNGGEQIQATLQAVPT